VEMAAVSHGVPFSPFLFVNESLQQLKSHFTVLLGHTMKRLQRYATVRAII